MTDNIIKQVPCIIENPIVVMRSKNINSHITMFGEVYSNNKPVLVVLELSPVSRKGLKLDELKIASAYGKDKAQNFINSSEILYVESNKKRVSDWEKRTRLQLPVGIFPANSVNSISNPTENVKQDSVETSDIRRSVSDDEGSKVDLSALLEDNDRLRKANDTLREQFVLTHGKKPNSKVVERLCRDILKKYSSGYDLDSLISNFTRLFEFMATEKPNEGSEAYDTAIELATMMAKSILNESNALNTDKSAKG